MIRSLLAIPFSIRQKRLAKTRRVITKRDFVSDIVSGGGDEVVAGMVWDAIHDFGIVGGFSPYPDDDLGYIYGISEEDLDEDLIMKIFHELRQPLPDSSFTEAFGPVDTPRKVSEFVSKSNRTLES
jgi:hypothetical protein